MKKVPQVPIVGDVWEQKDCPERTIEILKVQWRTYGWKRFHEVTYRTLTTPAKRPLNMNIVADMEPFQKRFRKHYPSLEDL